MIILLEGPDGAGKTTLADQITAAAMKVRRWHFGAPANDAEAFDYYKAYAVAIRECEPDAINIFDRSWYSDMVYGPVIRNRLEMTREHADMLSAMCVANSGGMVIYCTAPLKTLWSRCRAKGEDQVTSYEMLSAVADKYNKVMHEVAYLPVIRYDTAVRW